MSDFYTQPLHIPSRTPVCRRKQIRSNESCQQVLPILTVVRALCSTFAYVTRRTCNRQLLPTKNPALRGAMETGLSERALKRTTPGGLECTCELKAHSSRRPQVQAHSEARCLVDSHLLEAHGDE